MFNDFLYASNRKHVGQVVITWTISTNVYTLMCGIICLILNLIHVDCGSNRI